MKVTDMIREHHSESNAARPKIIGNKGAESTLQRPSRTPHLYLCAGPSRLNPKGMRSRMCFWHFLKGLSKKKKKKPLGTLRNVYFSSVEKESACNAGDPGSVPGLGRSPGKGNGNPRQYSCLENLMDRGAWRATVHGVTRVGHN